MIADVLKEHKPGDKPRFFLHDEMKEWLKNHLTISVTHGENRSTDYNLQQKLNLTYSLPIGFNISFTMSLDGEPVAIQEFNLPMHDYERAFKCLANVNERCMLEINNLLHQNYLLQNRIQKLENPPA